MSRNIRKADLCRGALLALALGVPALANGEVAWTNEPDNGHMQVLNIVHSHELGVIRVFVSESYAQEKSVSCINANHVDIPLNGPKVRGVSKKTRTEIQGRIVNTLHNALLGYRPVDFQIVVGECSSEGTNSSNSVPIAVGIRISN